MSEKVVHVEVKQEDSGGYTATVVGSEGTVETGYSSTWHRGPREASREEAIEIAVDKLKG